MSMKVGFNMAGHTLTEEDCAEIGRITEENDSLKTENKLLQSQLDNREEQLIEFKRTKILHCKGSNSIILLSGLKSIAIIKTAKGMAIKKLHEIANGAEIRL